MAKKVDFWFELASNYSYLSMMRIEALAKEHAVEVVWRPFLLGPIFKAFGWDTSPFVLQKEKGAYMWHDMVRECEKYGIPWTKPTTFPRLSVLPARVAIYGNSEPWLPEFCRRIMTRNFAEDQDIGSVEAVHHVLTDLGLDADLLIQEAQSEENRTRLRNQTDDARALGIFGAPTFFVGEAMYWGNDRLDDAILTAARSSRGGGR